MDRWGLIGLFLFLGAWGCAVREEGCLDVQAINFSVEAEKACSSCCQYPQLRLDLLHKYTVGDTLLNLTLNASAYPDGAGNMIRFKDIRFYISELHLLTEGGAEIGVGEELLLRKWVSGSDSLKFEVENNFALATPASLSRKVLGTFIQGGKIKGVRLTLGIGAPARDADPASAPTGHPLSPQADPLWVLGTGYLDAKLSVFPGNGSADTIPRVLEFASGGAFFQTIELPAPQVVSVAPGYHASVGLRIDYGAWFKQADVRNDSTEDLLRKIADNVKNSLAVTQITAQEN
ncbi:MAG: hypothetical protein IPI11_17005 [Haliscomenobacter sp.]|nr:hypothetical protein [Haliscomenobacter sp.]